MRSILLIKRIMINLNRLKFSVWISKPLLLLFLLMLFISIFVFDLLWWNNAVLFLWFFFFGISNHFFLVCWCLLNGFSPDSPCRNWSGCIAIWFENRMAKMHFKHLIHFSVCISRIVQDEWFNIFFLMMNVPSLHIVFWWEIFGQIRRRCSNWTAEIFFKMIREKLNKPGNWRTQQWLTCSETEKRKDFFFYFFAIWQQPVKIADDN